MGISRLPLRNGVLAIAAASAVTLVAAPSTAASAAARFSANGAAVHSGARLWVRYYAGPGAVNDFANSVAVAPDGSAVFVTGGSPSAPGVVDYATIGYSAGTGKRLWASRYGGTTSAGGGTAMAVAVGRGGRVFVTGASRGAGTGYDYVTIAYNAATGSQLWLSRYNGPPNGNDIANALAVSPDGGTVFVTGASSGGGTTLSDYATVAYDAATGKQLWVSRYNGPKSRADGANSLAVAPNGGTVYVTGQSAGVGTRLDYATVAYDAATGAQRWVSRYNGAPRQTDRAVSVAVSPGGHAVYVTGTSGDDFATISYRAATGAQRWVSRQVHRETFSGATSLAVGPSGAEVYVTGNFGFDIETVAYRARTGARLWVNRFRGRPLGSVARQVAVGPRGNTVYVTGNAGANDFVTIAYNAVAGSRRWVRLFPGGGSALAVSPATGTVFVTGSSDRGPKTLLDYATIAYHG